MSRGTRSIQKKMINHCFLCTSTSVSVMLVDTSSKCVGRSVDDCYALALLRRLLPPTLSLIARFSFDSADLMWL